MLASFCATTTNPKPSRKGQRGPAAPQANKSKRSGKGRQQQPAHVSESRHKQQAPATRSNQLLASSLAARTAPKGGTSQLHDELIDFAWRCAPTPASIKLSELSARAIELAWSRCSSGPAIRAVPFGSQPCAVALPGADLDLYVESVEGGQNSNSRKLLVSLHTMLEATHTFPAASQYIRARVPIVTGTLIGGMRVDVSAKVKGDYTADDGLALMQVCLDAQPHARPLLLALKALIKQEGFNKVFTGGLSSFTLFNMVSGILQHQAVTRARPHPPAFLPLLDALPKQSVLAHLQPEDLPTRFLPPLGARNQDMHERFTYCGLHAANSSWHLPPPTPFEEHVRSHRQKATGSGNGIASGASSRDDAWDPWSPERRGEGSGSGVMHGLQQLEFVRAAVSEGPDLGDLLLDLLHRYGQGWKPQQDSVHLRRMDPLASDASPYRREGQMGPEESLDVDDFQQRDFLSDLEALSDADDTDKDHLLTKAFANLPRQSSKSGRKRMGGSVGGGSQTSDAFQRERETHYEILSPFQDDGAAYMNLAGGSRQGKRIGKVLDASHRRLVKALQMHKQGNPTASQALHTKQTNAAAAVKAVVAYLGEFTHEERSRVRLECQQEVHVQPHNKERHLQMKDLQSNLRQGKKSIHKLQDILRTCCEAKYEEKLKKRLHRQKVRNTKWDTSLQELLSNPNAHIHGNGSKKAPEGQESGQRWGDIVSKGDTGKETDKKAGRKTNDISETASKMHVVADALAEVLLESREDTVIHKFASAAAAATLQQQSQGVGFQDYIQARPALKSALAKRCSYRGPSGTEAWLVELQDQELDSVIGLTDWALGNAVGKQSRGCKAGVVTLARNRGSTGSDGPGPSMRWKWERARIAVLPNTAYPVLGKVLDVGKALALPDVEGRRRSTEVHEALEDRARAGRSDGESLSEDGNGKRRDRDAPARMDDSAGGRGGDRVLERWLSEGSAKREKDWGWVVPVVTEGSVAPSEESGSIWSHVADSHSEGGEGPRSVAAAGQQLTSHAKRAEGDWYKGSSQYGDINVADLGLGSLSDEGDVWQGRGPENTPGGAVTRIANRMRRERLAKTGAADGIGVEDQLNLLAQRLDILAGDKA